jgi:hypothetical protein
MTEGYAITLPSTDLDCNGSGRVLGIAPRNVRDIMKRLIGKGLVVSSGASRNRTYRLEGESD